MASLDIRKQIQGHSFENERMKNILISYKEGIIVRNETTSEMDLIQLRIIEDIGRNRIYFLRKDEVRGK